MLSNNLNLYLKPYFFEPLAKFLHRYLKINDSHLNLLSVVIGVMVVPFMFINWRYTSVILLVLSLLCRELSDATFRYLHEDDDIDAFDSMADDLTSMSLALGFYIYYLIFGFYLYYSRGLAWVTLLLLAAISLLYCSSIILKRYESELPFMSGNNLGGKLIESFEIHLIFALIILFPKIYAVAGIALTLLIVYTLIARLLPFYLRRS